MSGYVDYAYFQCFYCKRVLPVMDEEPQKEGGPKICTWCNQERLKKREPEEHNFDCEFDF